MLSKSYIIINIMENIINNNTLGNKIDERGSSKFNSLMILKWVHSAINQLSRPHSHKHLLHRLLSAATEESPWPQIDSTFSLENSVPIFLHAIAMPKQSKIYRCTLRKTPPVAVFSADRRNYRAWRRCPNDTSWSRHDHNQCFPFGKHVILRIFPSAAIINEHQWSRYRNFGTVGHVGHHWSSFPDRQLTLWTIYILVQKKG